jgi:hypothetical protein
MHVNCARLSSGIISTEDAMTLKGSISEGHWNVAVETTAASGGGYRCTVHVTHELTGRDTFSHTFTHHRTFPSEHDAVIEGLRDGMKWIELKRTNAFDV